MDQTALARAPIPTFRLYGEPGEETGAFWLHCETIPERSRLHGWEIRPHRHEAFFQVLYISAGTGEALVDGRYRSFDHPAAIFVPAGAVHGFRFSKDIEGSVLTALTDRLTGPARANPAIAAFAERPRIIALAPDFAATGDLARTMARIHAELSGREPGRMVLLEALVAGMVVEIVRAAGEMGGPARASERDAGRIATLRALIATHFREHRRTAFYASALGLSEAHLNRLCRAQIGRSLQQMLNDRLIEAATRDLIFTPTPVQAIAFSLGFSDPAYFNRFFRRNKGMTPGAFRAGKRAVARVMEAEAASDRAAAYEGHIAFST